MTTVFRRRDFSFSFLNTTNLKKKAHFGSVSRHFPRWKHIIHRYFAPTVEQVFSVVTIIKLCVLLVAWIFPKFSCASTHGEDLKCFSINLYTFGCQRPYEKKKLHPGRCSQFKLSLELHLKHQMIAENTKNSRKNSED